MKLRRVLVTGGTGMIGAWVTRGFAERGITPIIFVRGQTDQVGRAINGDLEDRLVWAYGDLLDGEALARAAKEHDVQAIVHVASAKPSQIEPPWTPEPQPRQAIEQITLATLNVLEVARSQGIRRVVYASSRAVYGDVTGSYAAPAYTPLPEDYPCKPHMLYGICKLAAEQLGFYYARHFGIEFVAIRYASAFGPLKRGPTASSPDGMLYAAMAGEPVKIRRFREGERDDYVYNKDVAEGFVLAALVEKPSHLAYNLGSGRGITHEEMARAIRHVLPETKVEFADPDVGGPGARITDRARCIMDIRRAAADLDYRPRFMPLEAAFADFLKEERRMRKAGSGGPGAAGVP